MIKQTQTDYDKALREVAFEIEKEFGFCDNDLTRAIFRKGYEYGVWSQMEKQKAEQKDHERNLVALGDDYMTARIDAKDNGFNRWCDSDVNHDTLSAYFQGWNDADTFDDEWTAQHPKDLLDRIPDEYPDMIENEVKARMKDLQNECETTQKFPSHCGICPKMSETERETTQKIPSDHFADERKKVRMKIAMRAMQGIIPTTSPKNYQTVAQVAVNYADALLAELENPSNFSNRQK